jgi:hypothetical protein
MADGLKIMAGASRFVSCESISTAKVYVFFRMGKIPTNNPVKNL